MSLLQICKRCCKSSTHHSGQMIVFMKKLSSSTTLTSYRIVKVPLCLCIYTCLHFTTYSIPYGTNDFLWFYHADDPEALGNNR